MASLTKSLKEYSKWFVQQQKEFEMAAIGVSKTVYSAIKRDVEKQRKKATKETEKLKALEASLKQLKILKR